MTDEDPHMYPRPGDVLDQGMAGRPFPLWALMLLGAAFALLCVGLVYLLVAINGVAP